MTLRLRPAALALLGALTFAGCDAADPTSGEAVAAEAAPALARADGRVPGAYIVVFRDDAPEARADTDGLARRLVRERGGELRRTYRRALRGFAARLDAAEAEALRRDPRVAFVEEDQVVYAAATQSPAPWGLDRVDQRGRALDGGFTYAGTGRGVTAYVLDTGVRTSHREFGGRAVAGFDALGGGTTEDCHGHGTHVAGTVGGATYGVAKEVAVVAVRVLGCDGSGLMSAVVAGVDWVTANRRGPAVAVMSLGGGASEALDAAVRRSVASGVTYAVAAGNGDAAGVAQDACTRSPARVAEAITVGASDRNDAKTSWSNYGACVDLFAPGAGIASASHADDGATSTKSGTSMAAPHAAGAAALYLASNPGASPQAVAQALASGATQGVVTGASTPSNHLLFTGGLGAAPNAAPAAAFTAACTALACTFDASASADADGTIAAYAWTWGDGTSGAGRTAARTYAAAGTYTVTLAVTDDRGATATAQRTLAVSAPAASLTLAVTGRTASGRHYADLAWRGATGSTVTVYRNGARVTSTSNDGAYTQSLGRTGGTYTYKVCQGSTSACSNEATATF